MREIFASILGGWRAKKQVILLLTDQLVGHHMPWLPPGYLPSWIFNLTGVLILTILYTVVGLEVQFYNILGGLYYAL